MKRAYFQGEPVRRSSADLRECEHMSSGDSERSTTGLTALPAVAAGPQPEPESEPEPELEREPQPEPESVPTSEPQPAEPQPPVGLVCESFGELVVGRAR